MRGTWLAVCAVLALATGCGEASSGAGAAAEPVVPMVSPTAVPSAAGRVASNQRLLVSDDGTGPRMCNSGISDLVGPPTCDDFALEGWDWDAVGGSDIQDGVRWGSYALTGTFDGETFTVQEATQPDPPPYEFDFEIPCPTPDGGWQVVDSDKATDDARNDLSRVADRLPGHALTAVSTPEGEPGPRDPANTVVSVYVAGDTVGAEAALREVWGGMLCVTQVEHSHAELHKIQQELLSLPAWSEVGSGNPDNQVDVVVLHDDGSIQRWVDQEYGEGVVVVESILQPVG